MKATYYEEDDILEIRVSDKPIAREVSQDWRTHVSYAADGSLVEVVLLDARKEGVVPYALYPGSRDSFCAPAPAPSAEGIAHLKRLQTP